LSPKAPARRQCPQPASALCLSPWRRCCLLASPLASRLAGVKRRQNGIQIFIIQIFIIHNSRYSKLHILYTIDIYQYPIYLALFVTESSIHIRACLSESNSFSSLICWLFRSFMLQTDPQ
jgi:hypothetical protein